MCMSRLLTQPCGRLAFGENGDSRFPTKLRQNNEIFVGSSIILIAGFAKYPFHEESENEPRRLFPLDADHSGRCRWAP